MHAQELKQIVARLSGPNPTRILTKKEELEAILAWKNNRDESARRLIVQTHVKLAAKEVQRMRHYKANPLDLLSEGLVGITIALDKFEVDMGFRFSTYAIYWIRSKMNEHLLDTEGTMRIRNSNKHRRMLFGYRRAMANIAKKARQDGVHLSYIALQEKVAEAINVSMEDVLLFEATIAPANSLQAPMTPNSEGQPQTLADTIPDQSPIAEDIVHESRVIARMKSDIAVALGKLNEREKTIIMTRKMAPHGEEKTLEELSKVYGISRERVRQVEVIALQKLEKSLSATRQLLEAA